MSIYSKELTDYTYNLFIFAEQSNYNESLTNGRKLVEVICKLVIFHHVDKDNKTISKIRIDEKYTFFNVIRS